MPNSIALNSAALQLTHPQMVTPATTQPMKNPKAEHESNGFGEQGQLKKACVELESVFIYHLLKEMRATIPNSGLMGGDSIKDMYTHMTDSQLARELSNDGGIGLSDILFRQLNRTTADAGNRENEKID